MLNNKMFRSDFNRLQFLNRKTEPLQIITF